MFKSVTFEVVGNRRLTCEGCEQRVEHLLKGVPGVGKVRAQARNQRIDVLFDAAKVEPEVIAGRLSGAGYQTKLGSSTSDSVK